MSLALAKLRDLKAYFKNIAQSHVDIQGFKFGDKAMLVSANRSDAEPTFLWVEWFNPDSPFSVTEGLTDNVQKVKSVRVAFMVPTSRQTWQQHEDAYDFCEDVIDQIFARMYLDRRDLTILITAGKFKYGPTELEIGSTHYTGCAMSFEFLDPQGLIYDPEKWGSTGIFSKEWSGVFG